MVILSYPAIFVFLKVVYFKTQSCSIFNRESVRLGLIGNEIIDVGSYASITSILMTYPRP